MKRKQVATLILSGMLATGSVLPVMAADAPTSEPTAAVAAAGKTEANDSTKTAAPAVDAEGVLEDTKVSQAQAKAAAPAAQEVIQRAQTDNTAVPTANPPTDNDDVSGLVSEAALRSMSDNLNRLADETLAVYNGMTVEEKEALTQIAGNINVPAMVQSVRNQITVDALKAKILNAADENDANEILSTLDESVIAYLDQLKSVLNDAKNFASNYNQYLQSGISTAIKQLQTILVKDNLLYTQDYLAKAQSYYNKAVTLKPGVQSNKEIIEFCDAVSLFYQDGSDHLNTALLDEGLRAAGAFSAFLAVAPDPAIANTKFHYGSGIILTYAELPSRVIDASNLLKQSVENGTLTYNDFSIYASIFYGNLMEAYNGVSSAILSFASDQVKAANTIGYTGQEKTAYDNALKSYNDTIAGKNYSGLPTAADTLKKAAKAYADAAEAYAKTEGQKQIGELKKALAAIQVDIERHRAYYNDTYLAEITSAIQNINSADLDAMAGEDIMALIKRLSAVAEKQASSYSQKLTDLTAFAQQVTAAANEWWALLPDSMKGEAPYAEAVSLSTDLTSALAGSKAASGTVYDLDQLTAAYDAFDTDFNMADGKIQTAAKAVAQYVFTNAEKVYGAEVKKSHTDSVLKAFRTSIDTLKTSIASFDFHTTRTAAADVKAAQTALLNDLPVKEENTPGAEENKPVSETKNDTPNPTAKAEEKTAKTVKTGDDTNTAQAGLLGMLSLTGMVGALSLKRRR